MTPTGWKRNALAFALGVCATLTLAPFFIFPLIIPAFAGLLWLVANAPTRRRAFWDGWWWGYGFYITGLYWFSIALLVDPEKFAWLIPFTMLGLMAIIAIYPAIACWLTKCMNVSGLTQLFVFSVIWACVEYARGHLFTGFPWNLEGYAFGFSTVSIQLASLVGAYGLTWFAVLLGSSFASGIRKNGAFIACVWGVFVVSLIWGGWRLHAAGSMPDVPGVNLRLVQGNVPQSDKWDPKLEMQGVADYVRLTRSPGLDKVTHILWPETAVPFALKSQTPLARALGGSIPSNALLITGTLRAEGEGRNFRIWNSLVALGHTGNVLGSYDKSQLVPFGEFLPFRKYLPAFLTTPAGEMDFSRGPGPKTLEWPGLPPISPLICYEAIFPDRLPAKRPQVLVNVTDDAWFGNSIGPHQHFEMARMRAVEQGVPLVRVANTGISAVIDSFGRVISSLALGKQGVMDSTLPAALPQPTVYGRTGNLLLLVLILAAILLTIRQRITG